MMSEGLGDDTGSVRSPSIGNIPLAKYVRTTDEIEARLLEFAAGFTPEMATKLQPNYRDLISQISFGGKKSDSEKANVPEIVFGRNLFEGVTKVLIGLGDIFFMIVMADFNVSNFKSSRLEKRNSLVEELTEIEKQLSSTNLKEPSEKFFVMQHNVKMHDAEVVAKANFQAAREALTMEHNEEATTRRSALTYERSEQAKEFAKMKEFQEIEWQRNFIRAMNDYDLKVSADRHLKSRITEIKSELQKDNVLEQVCFAVTFALEMIANKIKSVIDEFYPDIKRKLQGKIKLYNGNFSTDPFTSQNLAGLYMALYTEYNKANISIFCKQLLDLLDEKSYADLTKAISEVTSELKQWNQLDLYQYMDQDKLFVMSLIRKLSTSGDVRKRAIERILLTAQKIENAEISPEHLGQLPLFDDLKDWLINVYQRSYEMTKQGSPNKQIPKKENQSYPNNARSYGTESAAAASAAPPAVASTSGAKGSPVKMVDRVINREVQRDELLFCTNVETGRLNLYTATKIPCPKCNTKDESIMHAKPRCYLAKCTKCGLFDHKHRLSSKS